MNIIDPILAELESEVANTRKTLERIPEDRFDWKPHEKSMTMIQLASHLAESPQWVDPIVNSEEFDFDPESYQPWVAASSAELLEGFDKAVEQARQALEGQSDESLSATWSFKMSGQVAFSDSRVNVLRQMILNHCVHHRGQLTVYLRLNDIPVPALYGPSADER